MPPPFCCLYGPDFQREGKTAVLALFQLEEKSAVSAVFERVLQFSAVVPCGMIHCRKLASLRSKTSPYMRRKIMFLQTADFQQFLNHAFSNFQHWQPPHIWTLFRPAAPPAPKRGENILKGIRGPDTPPVSPSAWPAQPARLNGREADFPPPSRSPRDLPCGRSRGPYCASAHTAACPPGALLMTAAGAGFFLGGYKGASARPHILNRSSKNGQ